MKVRTLEADEERSAINDSAIGETNGAINKGDNARACATSSFPLGVTGE
jgi:hypothetical protein